MLGYIESIEFDGYCGVACCACVSSIVHPDNTRDLAESSLICGPSTRTLPICPSHRQRHGGPAVPAHLSVRETEPHLTRYHGHPTQPGR